MNKLISFLTILSILFLFGCGSNEKQNNQKSGDQVSNQDDNPGVDEDEKQDNGKEDENDFMKGMKNFTDMMKQGSKVETVDFRKLKELLPEELDGMNRTSASGEKTNSFGIKVSQSEGKYKSEDGEQNIKITIIDLGSMKGLTGMALFAWTMAEIDKETEDGYEKTTEFKGYKAFEKYNTKNKNGDLEVIVGDRFMVKGEGWGVDMDDIHNALSLIDFSSLESMKNEGKKDS
ncbi:transposase [bacterium BMS3Abin03]|nr:transposase [bacterium BMS3Abin03]